MLSQYYTVKDISTILKAFYKHFDEKFFLTKAVEMKLPLKKTIKKFSTGMKAKLKVLMALSHQAKVLILDEPTTGLHIDDIKKLLIILNRIVDNGDTVIVIEHNLDMIKVADHIIDLGPDGGENGGTIVAEGTPEEIAKVKGSYTGEFLKKIL